MLPYPSGMTMSSRGLDLLADLQRGHRAERGTRWRKLPADRQALLVLELAHLRKNNTYADLACGFGAGTSTAYRCSARRSTRSRRRHPPWNRRSRSLAARRS